MSFDPWWMSGPQKKRQERLDEERAEREAEERMEAVSEEQIDAAQDRYERMIYGD